jgi:arylsulfatase A-like enzyme
VKTRSDNTKEVSTAAKSDLRCSVSRLFTIACFLSLSVGFFDVLATLFLRPGALTSSPVSLHLAAAVFSVLIAYLVLCAIAVYPVAKIFRLSSLSLSISLSVFILVLYTVAFASEMIPPEMSQHDLARFSILAGCSFLICLAAYFASFELARMSRYRRLALIIGCFAPLAMAEGVVLMWIVRLRGGPLVSPFSVLMLLGYAAALVGTLFVVRLITRRISAPLVLGPILIVLFLLPLRAIIFANSTPEPTRVSQEADLPIKHVVLIIVDTLRADFLSCLNSSAAPTPHIDALAADGVLFRKAISSAPWTVPSVASIMTGMSPLAHQVITTRSRMPDKLNTLAEYMERAGYYTGAIGYNSNLARSRNISQGFFEYIFPWPQGRHKSLGSAVLHNLYPSMLVSTVKTPMITELACDWIERNAQSSFFLWTHYLDPHKPYSPPPEYLPEGEAPPRIGNSFSRTHHVRDGTLVPTFVERDWIRSLYRSEVEYIDDHVGMILETMRTLGIYDDALLVLTSDHGEEFWEHGGVAHSHSLHDELLWVPLIMKLPRSEHSGEIEATVSLEGILPTVLDLCEIKYEPQSISGKSLQPAIYGDTAGLDDLSVFSTGVAVYGEQESVIFENLKYVLHMLTGQEELLDSKTLAAYESPPGFSYPEQLARARTTIELHRGIAAHLRERYGIAGEETIELDPALREQLRALGYMH